MWLVGLMFWWKTMKRRCIISSLKPFFDAFLGLSGQINIRVFSQSGQSDFIVIAIRAERLRIQRKQHTDNLLSLLECAKKCLWYAKYDEFSTFYWSQDLFTTKKMRPLGALPWKVVRFFFFNLVSLARAHRKSGAL